MAGKPSKAKDSVKEAATELGFEASRSRVARLMRRHAIRSIIRRKYRVRTR